MKRQLIINRIRAAFSLSCVLGVVLMLTVLCAGGCAGETSVEGGTSQQDTRGLEVTVKQPDGAQLSIKDNGTHQATSQPSITSNTGQALKLDSARPGEIAGFELLERAKSNAARVWGLALLFIAVGAGFWFLAGQRLYAAVSWSCAVLTLLSPGVMVFVAIGVGALFLWSIRTTLAQLVKGSSAVLESVDDSMGKRIKVVLGEHQDEPTKRVVKALKPTKLRARTI